MGNWKYYQLIATFYRALFTLIAQGVKINDAIHRVFEDFYFFPEKENMLSNLVIKIQYINMLCSLDNNINSTLVDSFNLQLEKINELKIEDYLDIEEIENLKESIDELKFKIKDIDKM